MFGCVSASEKMNTLLRESQLSRLSTGVCRCLPIGLAPRKLQVQKEVKGIHDELAIVKAQVLLADPARFPPEKFGGRPEIK